MAIKMVRKAASTAPVEEEEPVSTTPTKKAVAKPKAEKGEKTKKTPPAPKFTGRTTGLRIMVYQDKLMKENYKAKLTDAALAKLMRDEFPMAVAFTENHVRGIRSQWNHGKRPSQLGVDPAKTLTGFDAAGLPVVIVHKPPVPKKKAVPAAAAKPVAPVKMVKKTVPKKKAAPAEEEEETEE